MTEFDGMQTKCATDQSDNVILFGMTSYIGLGYSIWTYITLTILLRLWDKGMGCACRTKCIGKCILISSLTKNL